MKMQLEIRESLVWDVAVFGAGPAGIAAACTAARAGLRTLLVEPGSKIGGVMAVCPGMMLGAGYPLGKPIGGFFEEFVQRLYQMDPPRAVRRKCAIPEFGEEVIYDHEYAITVLYQMLEESGVELRLETLPLQVTAAGNEITGVLAADRSGVWQIRAGIYLDCTGNGDIAHQAGVPSQVGNEDGLMMGGTMTFFMENADWDRIFADGELYHNTYAQKGIAQGRLHPDIPEIYYLRGLRPGSVFFNTVTIAGVDGRDPQSVVRASLEARKRCLQLADFCKSDIPGFENAWISSIGPLMGIRETRKLEGMHRITIEEIAAETKFPDGIVACDNPIDDVFRGEARQYSNDRALQEGAYYTIPFRCLVPREVRNLMFAGRNISADTYAFASVRGMPQCMLMGQSVAVAAKIALDRECDVQQVDPAQVVEKMLAQGVNGIGGRPL